MGLPRRADPAHPDAPDAPTDRGDGQAGDRWQGAAGRSGAQIVARTDGVPLFVEELTKTVLEARLAAGGRGRLRAHRPPAAAGHSRHAPGALLARLDRLSEGKAVAQLGATLGRTFAHELLQAVAPLDELTVWRGLVELVQAEVLYQRVPPQATYTFKHALLQEAAYQSLLRSTRQQYHQHIAQVVADSSPPSRRRSPSCWRITIPRRASASWPWGTGSGPAKKAIGRPIWKPSATSPRAWRCSRPCRTPPRHPAEPNC